MQQPNEPSLSPSFRRKAIWIMVKAFILLGVAKICLLLWAIKSWRLKEIAGKAYSNGYEFFHGEIPEDRGWLQPNQEYESYRSTLAAVEDVVYDFGTKILSCLFAGLTILVRFIWGKTVSKNEIQQPQIPSPNDLLPGNTSSSNLQEYLEESATPLISPMRENSKKEEVAASNIIEQLGEIYNDRKNKCVIS